MSALASAVETGARTYLNDPGTGHEVIEPLRIRKAIDALVPEIADSCSLAPTRANIITTTAGVDAYQFGSGSPLPEYDCITALTLTGTPRVQVLKTSREHIQQLKARGTSSGRPQYWCAEPQSDQSVDITFWPVPDRMETVEALYAAIPEAWGTGAGTPPTIPFSRRAIRALELRVAASIVASMNVEVLNQLRLNPNVVVIWERDAAELLRNERKRVGELRNAHGRTHVAWLLEWRRT